MKIQFLSWERHNDVGVKPVNPNPLLLIIGCPAAVTINDQKLYRFVSTQKDENTIREMNDNINMAITLAVSIKVRKTKPRKQLFFLKYYSIPAVNIHTQAYTHEEKNMAYLCFIRQFKVLIPSVIH